MTVTIDELTSEMLKRYPDLEKHELIITQDMGSYNILFYVDGIRGLDISEQTIDTFMSNNEAEQFYAYTHYSLHRIITKNKSLSS